MYITFCFRWSKILNCDCVNNPLCSLSHSCWGCWIVDLLVNNNKKSYVMLSRNSDKLHLAPLLIALQQQQCCQLAARVSCSPADASPPGSRILCDSQSQVERTQSELLMAFATMTSGLDSVKSRIPVSFSLQSCLVLFTKPSSASHPRRNEQRDEMRLFPAVLPQQDHTNSFLSCPSLKNKIWGKSKKQINTFISILA